MLDIIYTKKEKIRVFLFLKRYKMMIKIFKSESTFGVAITYVGDFGFIVPAVNNRWQLLNCNCIILLAYYS